MQFLDTKARTATVTEVKVARRKKADQPEFSSADVARAARAGNAHFQYYVATGKLPVSK